MMGINTILCRLFKCLRHLRSAVLPTFSWEENASMQNQGESEFARTPVLENCAFFTCVQCGYCGYLILGGSAKELLDEEERHAIECKATHGLIAQKACCSRMVVESTS
jgi:hypothetical protein